MKKQYIRPEANALVLRQCIALDISIRDGSEFENDDEAGVKVSSFPWNEADSWER